MRQSTILTIHEPSTHYIHKKTNKRTRTNIQTLLTHVLTSYDRKGSNSEPSVEDVKNKQILLKSAKLRTLGGYICENAFTRRKLFLNRKKTGALRAKVPGAPNPMR